MKNFISFLLLFISFFASCKKSKIDKPYVPITRCADMTRNVDTINMFIQGNWEWVEEYRVTRAGEEYITPDSPGAFHLHLKLYGDTAKFFLNNILDSIYRFRVQRLSDFTNYPNDSLPVIVYYSFYTALRVSQVPIMICKNQLLMQHQYVNSFVGERLWIKK
jgi:hypothetical protein